MRYVALAVLTTFAALPAFAQGEPELSFGRMMAHTSLQNMLMDDAIDWKVGDTATYKFSMRGAKGTMVQSVTKDDGDTLWMRQAFKVGRQSQTVDVQFKKEDGTVVKVLENGEEVQSSGDDEELEIVSADEASVTVPAGTFDCLHIVARTSDGHRFESWNNDVDTVMDGTIKQIIGTDMGNMTFELVSFQHGT